MRSPSRSAQILLIVFGMLIGLIAISGVGALHRARESYRAVSALNERYRHTDQVLTSIASGISMVGLLARDYLLDPSNANAAQYRSQLVAERAAMEKEFRELRTAIRGEDKPQLEALRLEVEGYWDALDPLFEWTSQEKAARSWGFLRREILPRRRAALSITREISRLTQANLDQQRQEIDRNQAAVAGFIERMLVITVLLGLGIAAVTVVRMTKLERHSEQQRLRTEEAEKELRRLSRQLVQAQEEERKSLSRELHDEVGQMLTALRMELRSLQDLRTAPEAHFNDHLEAAKRMAEQSLRALRDLAMGLRPSMLDDLGLGSAVQWQARQFSKHTGIPVNVQITAIPPLLPEPHRTCIYRVVQEALTNCARHAKAKSIDVAIAGQADGISVSIRDDGIGFDPSNVRGRGLGLIGMQERVMDLGGDLTLVSQVRKGTVLSAKIPVPREIPLHEYSNTAGR
ncbi:MAG TPA: sensor histidine kinase [Bryobacteraceae bacterium]|nr:sensor histidine kinase [Bryobacteraceae bacterium]